MKENNLSLRHQDQMVVSSGLVLRAMQPSLKRIMSMRVINDNGSPRKDAIKQIFIGLAIVSVIVLFA